MSHFKRIHAIRVPLNVTVTQDISLGIYTTAGASEIRWSEYPVTGAAKQWTSGIISASGLGSEKQSADLRLGGAPAAYDGYDIVIQDTQQNYLALKELGISLFGRTIERWEFVGTDDDADFSELKLLSTLLVQDSSWNERQWTIKVRSANYTQNAPMGTFISNDPNSGNYPFATGDMTGKIVPITFGKFQIINGKPYPAKFIRTAGKQSTLSNSGLKDPGGWYYTPENQSIFPVFANFCGETTASSNIITDAGCTDYIAIGDTVLIWFGFSGGDPYVHRTVTGKSSTSITVSGDAAISTGRTYLSREHASGETESPNRTYVLKLGLDMVGLQPNPPPANNMESFMEDLMGKWIKVIEGGAVDGTSLVGKYRKIIAYQMANYHIGAETCVTVALESPFEKNIDCKPLVGAGQYIEDTYQGWVSIVDIPFEFTGDVFPCAGFIDDSGALIDTTNKTSLSLYTYKNETTTLERKSYSVDTDTNKLIVTTGFAELGFYRIAPYGYNATPSGNKNALVIDVMLFENDPSQLLSFDIIPLVNLSKYIASTLDAWGLSDRIQVASSNLYGLSDTGFPFAIDGNTDISGDNWHDRNDGNYLELEIAVHKSGYYMHDLWAAYEAEIDIAQIIIEYDAYFLGINLWSRAGGGSSDYDNSETRLLFRRMLGNIHETLTIANGQKYKDDQAGGGILNLPDFYYANQATRTPDNNKAFLFEKTLAASERNIIGYMYFPLTGIDSLDKLKSIYKIGLLFSTKKADVGYTSFSKTLHLNELALICKMSAPISTELYPLFSGRIFNDTWGDRKTSTDMITTISEIVEHCKRLGNWGTGNVEPGKEYDPAALIKLTGEGSFDSISLQPSTITWTKGNYNPTFQIEESNGAWTEKIVKDICQTYNICTYYDENGNACIKNLDKESPSETIQFSDLRQKESLPDLKPPAIMDIYCQPVLNYCFNAGSQKYDRQLIVTNIQAAVWSADFTIGFDNTTLHDGKSDGQTVWESCRALYLKYMQIETPPASWSNCRMIMTYEEAIENLKMKIAWMGKYRQPGIKIFYSKGRSYHVFQHVNFIHPHRTNGNICEGVVETLSKNKNTNMAELDLVLLDDPSMSGTPPAPAPPANPENLTFPAFTHVSTVKTVIFSDDTKSVVVWGAGQEATGQLEYGTDYTVQDHNKIVLNTTEYAAEIGANSLGFLNVDVYQGN